MLFKTVTVQSTNWIPSRPQRVSSAFIRQLMRLN